MYSWIVARFLGLLYDNVRKGKLRRRLLGPPPVWNAMKDVGSGSARSS
jgi:hypothetical protein